MACRRKEKMTRVDSTFVNKMEEVSTARIKNGLEKRSLGIRELTRMAQNTESFNKMLFELKTKPRKRK
jgi:hypothetical protein